MKSAITIILSGLFFFSGMAQGLILNMAETEISETGSIDIGDLTLTNLSSDEIEVAVRLEEVCKNNNDTETSIQICIDGLCFQAVSGTTTWGQDVPTAFLTLGTGESSSAISLKQLSTGGTSYNSEWNLVLFDRNNHTVESTLKVVIDNDGLISCLATTSATDFNYEIGKAFPNPAFETINIPYQIAVNEANLNIYNSTGILVKSVSVNPQAEQAEVNVSEFLSGVYFYNITDGKEQSKMMSFVK
ncbi:MAG: T9SS type A sorting domain-containing protein [Saprospiraceae bacterium]